MAVAQKIRCRIERIVPHGDRVYTVEMKPERPLPRFRPGQFLHLALDAYDPSGFWPESRVFSIASSPVERERLRIVYAVKGQFTARMEEEMQEGHQVWVKLPYGEFFIGGGSDVVLFAGGTGITAFTAYLSGMTPETPHCVYLAYGARSPGLLIERDAMERRAAEVPRFRVCCFTEAQPPDAPPDAGGRTPPRPGRLSAAAVWPDIPNPRETVFYLSGPPPMLKALTRELRDLGIGEDRIRIDAWE